MKVYKHPHKTGWLRVKNARIQLDIDRTELPTSLDQAKQILATMMAEREATVQLPTLELDPEFLQKSLSEQL